MQNSLLNKNAAHDGILFCSQLREEQLGEVPNAILVIFQAFGHLSKLTFDLDHTIQNLRTPISLPPKKFRFLDGRGE